MNMQRRPGRVTNKDTHASRRPSSDHDELLPWADPYIASLLRDHERQLRWHGHARRPRT